MVRSVTTKAKSAITDVAQRGVETVRSVASDAGAAAKAAADVMLETSSEALQAGRARVQAGHAGGEAGDRHRAPTEKKGREEEVGQEENGCPKDETSGTAIKREIS